MSNKCSFVNGGYADNVCSALADSVEGGRQTKKSKGIYTGSIVNFKTHERLGIQVKLKSGDFIEDGILLNFCPFCGNPVRDMSEY